MVIHITDEKVEKDDKPLDAVVWVDCDNNEACIFCHDRNGHKIPTDRDPTGYETLIVKGSFRVSKTLPAPKAAEPQPNNQCDPWGFPNYLQETIGPVDRTALGNNPYVNIVDKGYSLIDTIFPGAPISLPMRLENAWNLVQTLSREMTSERLRIIALELMGIVDD